MSMPYFALYPVDFLADVGHLGNTELGIYWRLLLVYYRDGKPLPCDTDRLRRIAMAFSPEECRCLDAIVCEFFVMSAEPDGTRVWRNRRADREIERASSVYANKVGGAEKARAARAAKQAAAAAGVAAVAVAAAAAAVAAAPAPTPTPAATPAAAPAPGLAGQFSDVKADASSDIKPDTSYDIKPDAGLTPTGESEPEPEPEPEKKNKTQPPAAPAGGPPPVPPAGFHQAMDFLVGQGVPAQTAVDWLKVRAKKRAPFTQTAWAGLVREAAAAGLTPAAAVQECAERGWQSLRADWLHGTKSSQVKSVAGMNYHEGADEHGNLD